MIFAVIDSLDVPPPLVGELECAFAAGAPAIPKTSAAKPATASFRGFPSLGDEINSLPAGPYYSAFATPTDSASSSSSRSLASLIDLV
ncbi:MAG: hypothetical protein ACRDPM_26645 [Solirubrobacteraceae bacterium]